ncbi:MAG: hypothetical protein Q7S85_05535 [Rugosibacter sp.]|nr:hypothetical protein [Rugosibacter sp.]
MSASRPLPSQSSRSPTCTINAVNERGETVPTVIAGEYPLTIYAAHMTLIGHAQGRHQAMPAGAERFTR